MTVICEHTIELPQSPAEVFRLLDDFARLPEWHAHCEGLAKQGHGPNSAGDRLRYAHRDGARHRLMDGVILTHDAPRRLTCRYFDKAMQVLVDYKLEPAPGGARLVHCIEITPRTFLGKLKAPMIRTRAEDQIRQAMTNLRVLLMREVAA